MKCVYIQLGRGWWWQDSTTMPFYSLAHSRLLCFLLIHISLWKAENFPIFRVRSYQCERALHTQLQLGANYSVDRWKCCSNDVWVRTCHCCAFFLLLWPKYRRRLVTLSYENTHTHRMVCLYTRKRDIDKECM